jgi:hypothetical protein
MDETDQVVEPEIKVTRIITNEHILQYNQMVESWIRNSICKNWNESSQAKGQDEVGLGNSGWTIADMRQYLFAEVFIALRNYRSDMSTKESTFVFGHLKNRVGSLMKKLTKKSKGYGIWSSNIEEVLGELDSEE